MSKLIKKKEVWIDEETGIAATIDITNGSLTINNSKGRQQFMFLSSKPETIITVANALVRLAALAPEVNALNGNGFAYSKEEPK